MRNLLFSTQKSLDGPWLLTPKSLTEFDAIINEYWDKLEQRRAKLLRNDANEFRKKIKHLEAEYREELNKQVQYYKEQSSVWSKSQKKLYIYLKDAPTYTCDSFDTALRDRYLLEEKAIGFGLEIISGDISC